MHKYFYVILSTFFFSLLLVESNQGQELIEEFGKNRVQYHDDFKYWWRYESEHLVTYWYGKGRNIAHTVVQLAEYDIGEIQDILEHRFNDKIEIVVYVDISDLKQSNIGSEEIFSSQLGKTKIVGNKVFVYFDGNHNELRKQIRMGIGSVIMNNMLFGANLQEIVQSAMLVNLPDWYKEGIISFIGEQWNESIDNRLKDIYGRKKLKDFYSISEEDPILAGHAFWNYIQLQYGRSSISNLLYLTRISRNMSSGFLFVLGVPMSQVINNCFRYYKDMYKDDEAKTEHFTPRLSVKHSRKNCKPISKLSLSPDGHKLLYVQSEEGRNKLYLHDLKTDKREKIMQIGVRNPFQTVDHNYPLIRWENNELIHIIFEVKDVLQYEIHNLTTGEITTDVLNPIFQRIYSFDILDEKKWVLSASMDGLSDLIIYDFTNKQVEKITDDYWDDLDVSLTEVNGKRGILFSSNRKNNFYIKEELDTILPIGNFDIFFLDIDSRNGDLIRISSSPDASERQAVKISEHEIIYLSDQFGVVNRMKATLKPEVVTESKVVTLKDGTKLRMSLSAKIPPSELDLVSRIDTVQNFGTTTQHSIVSNYDRNILYHSASINKLAQLVYKNESYHIDISKLEFDLKKQPINSTYLGFLFDKPNEQIIAQEGVVQQNKDIQDAEYKFQSKFGDFEKQKSTFSELPKKEQPLWVNNLGLKEKEVVRFNFVQATAARLRFRVDDLSSNMDNNPLFSGLGSFAGTEQEIQGQLISSVSGYQYNPLGLLMKGSVKDLFEDYQFEGGVRFPTSFNGTEWFLVFDDRKDRWDKRYAFYRKGIRETHELNNLGLVEYRPVSNIAFAEFRYPFNIFNSFRFAGTLRMDRNVVLSTDRPTLMTPDANAQRLGLKISYVYDDTYTKDINMRYGTRAKVYVEAMNKFEVQFDPWKFKASTGFLTIIGLDARHYLRLDKRSILAFKFEALTSLGNEHVAYYLGGVNNWFFPKYNDLLPLPENKQFAYQGLAANMRGFPQNIRNGASYALFNMELRVPFVQYLSRRKLRSAFYRNLQLVGFFDAGSAWHGLSPYGEDNPLNMLDISRPPTLNVHVNYYRDPIVFGYGAGLRALVFGYFLKLDYAWGIETRSRLDPVFHFSMGKDF